MSQAYLIIRTDDRKEAYVASQIVRMGFDAWTPCQIELTRSRAARRFTSQKALATTKEIRILPKRIFAAVPVAMEADILKIRYCVAIERDAALAPLQAPANQVAIFRREVDMLNAETMALAKMAQGRKTKAKWRSLKEALEGLMKAETPELETA